MRIPAIAAGSLLATMTLASAQTSAPAPVPAPRAGAMPSDAPTTVPAAQGNFIRLANDAKLGSNLIGLNVHNGNKDEVGEIKDIAFDASGVKAYILSVGGFLGMGTHYVAVTPSQVNVMYDTADKKWRATMNATKDELKAAPEFKYEGMWNAGKS